MTEEANGKVQDGRVQATLDAILVRLSAVEEDMRNIRKDQRTPAATWIAAGSLVVVVGTLSLNPVSRSASDNSERIQRVREYAIENRQDQAGSVERLAGLEGRYRARVEEVNRRLVEDVGDRINRLEERNAEQFERLRFWIANLEKEVDQHYRDVNPSAAKE